MFNKRAVASEATLRVEQPDIPPVTFLTCDGPLGQHNLQELHVSRWQSGCVDAWNKGDSALLISTVLFTSVPQSRVYKADFQRDKHSECRHKPVLLVWSRYWWSSLPVIPFVTKASRILTAKTSFSRQGVFTNNIERPRNCEYPSLPRYRLALSTDENLPTQPPSYTL